MNLIERDKNVIWHPYSEIKSDETIIPITHAKGSYLFDYQGKRYIDGISSWWVTNHGHSNEYIAKKVYEQLLDLEHVIFAKFTHQPAISLAERLLELLGSSYSKVFYSDNGSTAVEVALKMCVQYWRNQNIEKHKFLALEGSYHGDTFGSMSVSERGIFTECFSSMLFDVDFVAIPDSEESCIAFEHYIKNNHTKLAGFIFEPLVQGAGGMKMYSASILERMVNICKKYHVLTIADEVMTGFGRTGTLFATHQIQTPPDIICLSKCLTGGVMPLSATICNQQVFELFNSSDKRKMLYHGHSYAANPTACAAALANLDLMEKPETQENIQRIQTQHSHFLLQYQNHTKLKKVRQTGTILAMDWYSEEKTAYLNPISKQLNAYFLDRGILLRPLGNVLYILPPYCISNEDLNYIYLEIENALNII